MNIARLSAVLTAVLVLGACEEGSQLPTESHHPTPRVDAPTDRPNAVVSIGSQTPTAGVPPEYQQATWLTIQADAGWVSANTAYGQGILEYGGNNATLDVNLVVRNVNGTVIASNSAHSADSHVFPSRYSMNRTTNAYVTQTCGLIAQATATGEAWDSFLSSSQQYLVWGKLAGSDTKGVPQQACPTTGSTSSGSGYYPPPTTDPYSYTYSYPYPNITPGHWECIYYNYGTYYELQNCYYYPSTITYGSRAPSTPTLLASRGTLTPTTIGASSSTTNGTNGASSAAELPSVYVVVSDQVPDSALAVIERHAQGPFRNVLLVPSRTIRPAVFAAALQALLESRAARGETPSRDLRLVLRGDVLDQQIPSDVRNYAEVFTNLLASARPVAAGPLGTVPLLHLYMAQRR